MDSSIGRPAGLVVAAVLAGGCPVSHLLHVPAGGDPGAEIVASGDALPVVDIEDLRQFVLDRSDLDEGTVNALIVAYERYLALIGATGWDAAYDTEAQFEADHARFGIPGTRTGEYRVFSDEGLVCVAKSAGVSRSDTEEFSRLEFEFLQSKGLVFGISAAEIPGPEEVESDQYDGDSMGDAAYNRETGTADDEPGGRVLR